MGEHSSSANFFRNFQRQKKILCVWSKMDILCFYFVGQNWIETFITGVTVPHFAWPDLFDCSSGACFTKIYFCNDHYSIFFANWTCLLIAIVYQIIIAKFNAQILSVINKLVAIVESITKLHCSIAMGFWFSDGYTRCLIKKYGVADYQYFKNGKTQQCDIFRLNNYNLCLVECVVSTPLCQT